MQHRLPSGEGYNIFARELENILQAHGLKLGHLTTRAEIHPEIVNRLRRSLKCSPQTKPKFHLLHPDELGRVIDTFQFTGDEQLRLRAAILTTAIEKMLMKRIGQDNALAAAEDIFPILLAALHARLGQQGGIAATRSGKEPAIDDLSNDEEAVPDFEPILEQFDRAMLALYLARQSDVLTERVEQAREAYNGFAAVLVALQDLGKRDEAIMKMEAWHLWYEEAQYGQATAEEYLPQLEL
jgi:hypothetical protein